MEYTYFKGGTIMITLEKYLQNPCKASSLPYWKTISFEIPNHIQIVHELDYNPKDNKNCTRYFKLIHNLELVYKEDKMIKTIDLDNDLIELEKHISKAYNQDNISVTSKDIESWSRRKTYNESLWVKIIRDNQIIASGIAEYDHEAKEGILDWIQINQEYRKQGYGEIIVIALIYRLSKLAKYITVSGKMDSISNPIKLYEKCGFENRNIWYVYNLNEMIENEKLSK